MKRKDEAGFTLIEVLVVCTLLGVLATVAVPKFSGAVTAANTAKIQTDLQTLDAAIVMYETERGVPPANITDLSDYVADVHNLKPPTGKCRLRDGTTVGITATTYAIQSVAASRVTDNSAATEYRATCDGKTAGDFGR